MRGGVGESASSSALRTVGPGRDVSDASDVSRTPRRDVTTRPGSGRVEVAGASGPDHCCSPAGATFASPGLIRFTLYWACLPFTWTRPAMPTDSVPSSITQRTESIGPGLK